MNVLTKLALGMMGQLRPKPAKGESATSVSLPPPTKHGGLPLMEALSRLCERPIAFATVIGSALVSLWNEPRRRRENGPFGVECSGN
jgi:hypothetical protein